MFQGLFKVAKKVLDRNGLASAAISASPAAREQTLTSGLGSMREYGWREEGLGE